MLWSQRIGESGVKSVIAYQHMARLASRNARKMRMFFSPTQLLIHAQ